MPADSPAPRLPRARPRGRVVATVVWLLAALAIGFVQAWPDGELLGAPPANTSQCTIAAASIAPGASFSVRLPARVSHRPDANRDDTIDAAGAPVDGRAALSAPTLSTHLWHATRAPEAYATPVFRLELRGPPSTLTSTSVRS